MTFDEAVLRALEQRKYDRLMDRAFDLPRLIGRVVEAVIRWLAEHIHLKMPEVPDYDVSLYAKIFAGVAIAVLIAIAVAVFTAMRRRRKRGAPLADMFEELADASMTFDRLKALGAEWAAKGDRRMAVRYEYIAALRLLNDRNIIFIDGAKTNGQLKREVAENAPKLADVFGKAVNVFQWAWFGHKPVSPQVYAAYAAEMEGLAREAAL